MKKKGQEAIGGFVIALLIIAIIWGLWAISIVQYNEFAYEREFGKLHSELKEPGFTWVGFGTLERVNNQVRTYTIKVDAATNDMQQVVFDVNINAKIKKDSSYDFIKDYKSEDTFIDYLENKIQEKSKAVIFEYGAQELLKNRLNISRNVYNEVSTIPELTYFEIKDITLSNIDFAEEYDKILERKAQVEIERDIIINQKENLRLLEENMNSIDIDTYFKYQIVEKWDGLIK